MLGADVVVAAIHRNRRGVLEYLHGSVVIRDNGRLTLGRHGTGRRHCAERVGQGIDVDPGPPEGGSGRARGVNRLNGSAVSALLTNRFCAAY